MAVKLSAYDAGFSSTLAKAKSKLSAFGAAASSIGTGIGLGIGMGIASAASAIPGQVASLVSSQMEAIDKVAKSSDTLGTATEKLIGLGYAGDLAGASMESITGAMAKMNKALGEAIGGSKSAQDAFDALGLDVRGLATIDATDAFGQIADAINRLPNAAQRTAAAMDIFGKSAADLMPLLATGSEGIAAATAEAEAFGLAVNRVDAAKIEQANDAMTRVKSSMLGLGTTIAVQVAPYITKLAEDFVAWATEGGRATNFIIDALEWVSMAVVNVSEVVQAMRAAWFFVEGVVITVAKNIITEGNRMASAFVASLDLIGLATDSMKESVAAADEVIAGLGIQAADSFKKADDIMSDIGSGDSANRVKKWFADARAAAEEFGKATAEATKPGTILDPDEIAEAVQEINKIEAPEVISRRSENLSPALLLANSAQAQLFQFNAGRRPVEDQQLTVQKQMVATLKQIEKNTDFADDGEYSGL